MSTQRETKQATHGRLGRVRAWLSKDSGEVLLESLAALVVGIITIASFSVAFVNSNHTQRSQQYADIASQVGRGVIEQARSTDYAVLGFTSDDGAPESFNDLPTVFTEDAETVTDRILPYRQVTVRGLTVSIVTNIVTAPNGRGKDIHVETRYRNPAGENRVQSHVAYVTPAPNQPIAGDINNIDPQPTAGATWYGD